MIQVLFIILILVLTTKLSHGDYIPFINLYIIRVWYGVFTPLAVIPIFYRVAYSANGIFGGDGSLMDVFGFVFSILNAVIMALSTYLSSVFLDPCISYFQTALDCFDSRTNILLFLDRALIVCCNAFSDAETPVVAIITIVLNSLLFFITFYYRVSFSIYNSEIASFIEMAPLFANIPTYIIRYFVNLTPYHTLAVYVLAVIVYALFHFIYTRKLRKHAVQFFLTFVTPTPAVKGSIPHNLAAVIRIASFEIGTPEIFDNFIRTVGVEHLRPEHILEISRFMSSFTSRGVDTLNMIDQALQNTHSPYYSVQLYFMKKNLSSLLFGAKEKDLFYLDLIHRNYIVDMHLYWNYKAEKKHWQTYLAALHVAYHHFELVHLIRYLLRRFPLDGDLRIHYADILFIALGEAKKSILNRRLGMKLKENISAVDNPIYSQYSKLNPHLTRYQRMYSNESSSDAGNNSTSSSSKRNSISSSNAIRFHFDDEIIQLDDNTTLAAAFVQKSKRYFPIGIFFNALIAVLAMVAAFILVAITHYRISNVYNDILSDIDTLHEHYLMTPAGLLFPHIINMTNTFIPEERTEEECRLYYSNTFQMTIINLLYFPLSRNMQTLLANEIFLYVNSFSTIRGYYREKLINFFSFPGIMLQNSVNSTLDSLNHIQTYFDAISYRLNSLYYMPHFAWMIVCIFVVTFIITNIIFYVSIFKKKLKEEDFITSFLASPNRLSLCLLER